MFFSLFETGWEDVGGVVLANHAVKSKIIKQIHICCYRQQIYHYIIKWTLESEQI